MKSLHDKPRCLIIVLMICFMLGVIGQVVATAPSNDWIEQQADQLPKDQVEKYWDQLMKQYGGFFRRQNAIVHGYVNSGMKDSV